MSQQSYNVGDILFVLDEERQRIVPIQVVSVTSKRTVEGVEISYEIVTPAKPDKPVNLNRVNGQIYTSLSQLQQVMLDNARSAIDAMVRRAAAVASQIFAQDQGKETDMSDLNQVEPDLPDDGSIDSNQSRIRVELPDGSEAWINSLPSSLAPLQTSDVQGEGEGD